ncbi:structure-specific endonuclease subunit SLX1, partial [Plectropomus leopardus]|uniref:structure-specific endonuclease subunit SLX1 n=1 Tax=Plectropomus leopardus TaxID=160734 RepID=UPI001C4AC98F
FEWAWQHPRSSRRLSHVSWHSRKESSLQFHWRVVSNMLRVAPWNRLPLTARWLKQEYRMDFEPSLQPPLHIPVAFGSVRAKKKLPPQSAGEDEETSRCSLCKGLLKQVNFRVWDHNLSNPWHLTIHEKKCPGMDKKS